MVDVVEEFNKLRQDGLVEDYQKEFKELRAFVRLSQTSLTEPYFVSSFISGLKDKLRSMVKMLMPTTVKHAVKKAKLQELMLEAICNKYAVGTEILRSINH